MKQEEVNLEVNVADDQLKELSSLAADLLKNDKAIEDLESALATLKQLQRQISEVDIPAKSFQQTVPEYINPVNGDELGEQTVSVNVEEHLGIYYFENRQAVLDWIENTLDAMPGPVSEPDGEQDNVPQSFLPTIPDIYLEY